MSHEASRRAFFRQSGWMVMASFLGGVFMFAVHGFAPVLGDAEYSLFGTLLAIINVLGIPSLGLQTTFAQQAASAVTAEQKARLAGTARGLLGLTFLIWAGFVVIVLLFRTQILGGLVIPNPVALWLVLLIGLGSLWQPILYGVLQGRQDFLWLGWAAISGGLGRFVSVAIIVLLFGGRATGAICGALLGVVATVLLAGGRSRMVWAAPDRLPIAWTEWLWQTFLLSLGLGAWQFIFSVDMIVVRYLFGEEQTGFYSASGMLARGMVMFTVPIAAVMFPKVVRSVSQGGEGRVLAYTLGTTGLLGAVGAAGCTLVALAIQFVLNHPDAAVRVVPGAILNKMLTNREGMASDGRPDPLVCLVHAAPGLVQRAAAEPAGPETLPAGALAADHVVALPARRGALRHFLPARDPGARSLQPDLPGRARRGHALREAPASYGRGDMTR